RPHRGGFSTMGRGDRPATRPDFPVVRASPMDPTSLTGTTQEQDMGRVVTPVLIENLSDLILARNGSIPIEAVRRLEVPDALVDTGARSLCLPVSLIAQLGLEKVGERPCRTAGGLIRLGTYSAVQLTIQGRDTVVRVTELPEGSPALIGQIPLEDLD